MAHKPDSTILIDARVHTFTCSQKVGQVGIEPTTKGIMSRFRCVLTSDEINSELVLFLNACSSHVDLSAIFQPVRRTKWRDNSLQTQLLPAALVNSQRLRHGEPCGIESHDSDHEEHQFERRRQANTPEQEIR